MNNFTTRTITGVLFVIGIIGSVILSKWAFAALFLVVAVGGFLEYSKIIRISKVYPHKLAGIVLTL